MPESRGQFTFYRSYYEAIRRLSKKEQAEVLLAICGYALDEIEPTLGGVSAAIFDLVKPTLDTGRRKAMSRQGKIKSKSNEEQNNNKSKSNAGQSCKEKEIESEVEGEYEIERELEYDSTPPYSPPKGKLSPFDIFWEAYPRKAGKAAARKAFAKIPKSAYPRIVPAIEAQKQSAQWQKDGGQYIPYPATWINRGEWENETQIEGLKTESGNVFARLVKEGKLDE